jgi:hypothetical protein
MPYLELMAVNSGRQYAAMDATAWSGHSRRERAKLVRASLMWSIGRSQRVVRGEPLR